MSEAAGGDSCQNGRALAPPRTRLITGLTSLFTALTVAALWATPAAAGFLSSAEPNSAGAEEGRTLYWIAMVVAVVIAVAVNLALLVAFRRYRARRGERAEPGEGSPGLQLRIGGALTGLFVVLLTLGIIFSERSMDSAATAASGEAAGGEANGSAPIEIDATGQQWLWRYDYPDEAYSYYRLTVPVDTRINLDVLSTDVVHSWLVPALGAEVEAVPGSRNRISFTAQREGIYEGSSAVFSGQAYAAMRTEVEVVSQEEYEDFIEQRLADTQAAQESAARAYNERQGEEQASDQDPVPGEGQASDDGQAAGDEGTE